MNFADYDGLKSAIADELNRTDLSSAISGFISLCEAQTEREIRTKEMIASIPFVIDAAYKNLPDDFLEVRSFWLNTNPKKQIEYQTIEHLLNEKEPLNAYTIVGNQFLFSPAPSEAANATLVYYKQIPKLSNANQTNWVLSKHPDLYFYGSLVHSAPYLKEDVRIQVWAGMYANAIQRIIASDDRSSTASNNLKSNARVF